MQPGPGVSAKLCREKREAVDPARKESERGVKKIFKKVVCEQETWSKER